ncbi:MAG TPA: quinone oxidoreductase [Thermomicrobiales bacterium]|jgi:NADPH2:quinone reductase
MKAIMVHEFGGPEVLRYEDVPTPEPGAGEVVVAIEAIGVNFIDTYHRGGLYKNPLPLALGQEGAGKIAAVGDGVTDFQVGDHVAWKDQFGSYGEQVAISTAKLVPVPEGVSSQQAAATMLQGMTAHYLAHSTFPLKEGDTCLIHAAAGGVGLLLTQMAKLRGARVLATAGSEEKAELARGAGADEVVLYRQDDFAEAAKRFTNGKGLDVVYDGVGKDTFNKGLTTLRPRGYMVLFGQSSGPVPPMDPQILNARGSLFLTRPSLGFYTLDREELLWRAKDLFGWIAEGKLNVRIGHTYPLADAAQAQTDLAGRKTTGKVLLIP